MFQDLATKVHKISSILRASGFSHDASKLEELLKTALQNSAGRQNALNEIRATCSIKSLGDLNVKGVDDKAWLKLLAEARQLAQ